MLNNTGFQSDDLLAVKVIKGTLNPSKGFTTGGSNARVMVCSARCSLVVLL